MHELRYSFRPGHAGASIAGPHCLDKPGDVRIASDCLCNYGLSAFLPFSNFHALPIMHRAEQGASSGSCAEWGDLRAIWGGLLPDMPPGNALSFTSPNEHLLCTGEPIFLSHVHLCICADCVDDLDGDVERPDLAAICR